MTDLLLRLPESVGSSISRGGEDFAAIREAFRLVVWRGSREEWRPVELSNYQGGTFISSAASQKTSKEWSGKAP